MRRVKLDEAQARILREACELHSERALQSAKDAHTLPGCERLAGGYQADADRAADLAELLRQADAVELLFSDPPAVIADDLEAIVVELERAVEGAAVPAPIEDAVTLPRYVEIGGAA